MKNYFLLALGLLVVGAAIYNFWQRGSLLSSKLRACPDAWYENKMPSPEPRADDQYFIIGGTRRELHEVDIDWVKSNCEINKPSPVY